MVAKGGSLLHSIPISDCKCLMAPGTAAVIDRKVRTLVVSPVPEISWSASHPSSPSICSALSRLGQHDPALVDTSVLSRETHEQCMETSWTNWKIPSCSSHRFSEVLGHNSFPPFLDRQGSETVSPVRIIVFVNLVQT